MTASNAERIVHHEDLSIGNVPAPIPITGIASASVMRFASQPARTPVPAVVPQQLLWLMHAEQSIGRFIAAPLDFVATEIFTDCGVKPK